MQARGRLGYVPQQPAIALGVPATVEEIVASGRLARGGGGAGPRVRTATPSRHAIESVGLADMAERRSTSSPADSSSGPSSRARSPSEPDLLVLDEPIAGVDAESQRRFRDALVHLIAEHGAGVLLVSHELSAVAEDLDRVVVLQAAWSSTDRRRSSRPRV